MPGRLSKWEAQQVGASAIVKQCKSRCIVHATVRVTTGRGRSLHSLCEEGWQRAVERAGAQVHNAQRHLPMAQALLVD